MKGKPKTQLEMAVDAVKAEGEFNLNFFKIRFSLSKEEAIKLQLQVIEVLEENKKGSELLRWDSGTYFIQ